MKIIAILLLCAVAALAQNIVSNPTAAQLFANDNNVLGVAITVENFDTNYYASYLEGPNAFTLSSFRAANINNADAVYQNFLTLLANERAHVSVLQSTLMARNNTMLPLCTYSYPTTTNVNDFIFYSKLFENVGTAAYDGSINAIYNTSLQTAAATIATVEARHAAFLNSIPNITVPNGFTIPNSDVATDIQGGPFPFVEDLAFTPPQVYALINKYLTCPYALFMPSVNVVVPISPPNPSQTTLNNNDLNTLNYALTLELLEATYYNTYVNNFAPSDYATALGLSIADATVVAMYINMVKQHENTHVTILRTAITSLGGTPVGNCTYTFGNVNNVTTFLATASQLEQTGVSAYDGAVNTLFNPTLRTYAAQIATVEARHSAYINSLLNATNAYTVPLEPTLLPTAVLTTLLGTPINGASAPILTNCPSSGGVPQVYNVVPMSNSSVTTSAPTTTTPTTTTPTTVLPSTATPTVRPTTSPTSNANTLGVSVLLCVVGVVALL